MPLICCASDGEAVKIQNDSQENIKKEIEKAVSLIKSGSYKEAETILTGFIENKLYQRETYFLLGRIYKEQGIFDKAEDYLKKAVDSYPLLKDYAFKLLADVYISSEKFDKAVEAARQIQGKVLLKEARKYEITAILGGKRDDEAIELLSRFTKDYPNEWKFKLNLARLLNDHDKTDSAVSLFKEIYLNAVPVSPEALNELKELKADIFTNDELLRRADNLFEKGNYQRAEKLYRDVLASLKDSMKEKIIFSIGMCQFRQKQYDKSAKSFKQVKSPDAMYQEAISYYRFNDEDSFNDAVKRFGGEFPGDERFVRLLLISADNFRRAGKAGEAEEIFKRVLKDSPAMAEDANWGLGWMSYAAGDYGTASKYFLKLANSVREDNYKYLYWQGRSLQKLTEGYVKIKAGEADNNDSLCDGKDNNFFAGLAQDKGYYGYLAKLRHASDKIRFSMPDGPPANIAAAEKLYNYLPPKPEGETYERIESLVFLGFKDEAINEINAVIQKSVKPEFLYLSYLSMRMEEYKKVIAMAEGIDKNEFLLLSYPLGYRDIVRRASEAEKIDAYLITALIREESRFDPSAVSGAGAIGLMQIIPSTANRLKDNAKIKLKDDSDIHDAEKNILIGAHYLSLLIREFKEIPLALAAYNAGEKALEKWLSRYEGKDMDEFIEDIPYAETKKYVKKVLRSYWQYRTIAGLPLFTPLEITPSKMKED
ncbi:MAG: transglycosylase SLT domain-containing protein [Nitrospirae bacterium]|nr:transglycosylase SLT domain-containing protein [Nitrospirota bacterium]